MEKIKYIEEQIKELKNNLNVKNCTSKHIVFTKKFKIKAVELANILVWVREIFEQFWFPEYVINLVVPKNVIYRWKRNMKFLQKYQILNFNSKFFFFVY